MVAGANGLNMDVVRDAQDRVRTQLEADRVRVRGQELRAAVTEAENQLVGAIDRIGYQVNGNALYVAGAQDAYEKMRAAAKEVIRAYLAGPAQSALGELFDTAYDLGHANNTPFRG